MGVRSEDHAIAYLGDAPPPPLDQELLALTPIKIDPLTPTTRVKLDKASRINYGKIYTVEHNVKVEFLGKVDETSWKVLLEDFDRVWSHVKRPEQGHPALQTEHS